MIVPFLITVAAAFVVAFLGRARKFGFWGYFFASMLMTPLVGLVLILASDPLRDKED